MGRTYRQQRPRAVPPIQSYPPRSSPRPPTDSVNDDLSKTSPRTRTRRAAYVNAASGGNRRNSRAERDRSAAPTTLIKTRPRRAVCTHSRRDPRRARRRPRRAASTAVPASPRSGPQNRTGGATTSNKTKPKIPAPHATDEHAASRERQREIAILSRSEIAAPRQPSSAKNAAGRRRRSTKDQRAAAIWRKPRASRARRRASLNDGTKRALAAEQRDRPSLLRREAHVPGKKILPR